MNATKNQTRRTAEEAYALHHELALGMLDSIRGLIEDLPAPGERVMHWGHVGSMAEVAQRLAAVVNFLDGSER